MKPVPPGLFQYNDNDPQHQHGNQQGQFKPEHGIHGQYRKTQLPDDAQGHIEHVYGEIPVSGKTRILL